MTQSSDKMYLEVLKEINYLIHADDLKSGDRLPSERELSDRLDVGRSSVREALRALELLELIETRPGGGTYIKAAGGRRLVEIIASFILKEDKAREDLGETRLIVEKEAIRLACQRASIEDLEAWKAVLNDYRKKVEKGETPVEEDYLFHSMLVKCSHNHLLHHIWIPLVEYSKAALEESLARSGRPILSLYEHERIYEAVLQRDAAKAVEELSAHLQNSAF
ncbi:FadR/GntR family transcriptional regulator [Salsuginibacillus kocurii]|uniref:FadR/GntR family transcriptional regulator n=1 Tax=Salsuginibacillus kocurii TaxID=427078 RepID=UPI000374CB28|nr:FCD domain-containing protein [Salsuginibacillus kocurii]